MLNTVWQRKHRWLGHVFKNELLLKEIIEGRIKGNAFWEERDYIC